MEKKLNDTFALSVGLERMPNYSRDVYGYQNGRQIGFFTIDTESTVLMLNGYINLPKLDSFRPYLTAGIGYANNVTVQNEYTYLLFSVPYSSNETDNVAYKLGIGTRYTLNELFDLNLHHQFKDLGYYQTGTYTYDNRVYGGVRGRFRVNEIVGGLVVKF